MSKPVAYSYVRFSTPEQRKGDSLRRQTEAAAKWCEQNSVQLDTSLTLHDLGLSAYDGENLEDTAALGEFIKLCEAKRVPPGSFLIIERLDRLTRKDLREAIKLFFRLTELVNVVQIL